MKKGILSALLAAGLIFAVFALPIANAHTTADKSNNTEKVDKSSMVITDNKENQSSEPKESVEEPEKNDETVTFIVTLDNDSLLDTVINSEGKYKNVTDLLMSGDGKAYYDKIKKEQAVVKASIQKVIAESDFTNCYTYVAAVNGFTVKAPYSSIEKIKKINNVADVTLASAGYGNSDMSEEIIDLGSVSKDIVNSDFAYESGYTGKNVLIAVIDNSFDCSHEAFSVSPDETKYDANIMDKLYESVSFNTKEAYKSSDIYVNQKIVFAYDYADNDNDTYCSDMSHGTHVAGIAAGNNGKTDSGKFTGMAYDAQLAFMKICGDSQGIISDDTIIAALDDAVKIGADIINCSFGAPKYGYGDDIITSIYEKLSNIGVYIVAAAGNGSFNIDSSKNDMISSSYIDYSTIYYPSSLSSVLSVGAVNSENFLSKYFTANEEDIIYYETRLTDENDNIIDYDLLSFADNITEETEYVYINKYGAKEDYDNIDVTDKIVIINSGEVLYEEKINNAYENGAKAIIIINSENSKIKTSVKEKTLPTVVVSNKYMQYFSENPEGAIVINENYYKVSNQKSNGNIANYSSYGVTADLKLKPEIVAPGTNIYSVINNNKYDTMSGTSMASPCVAGSIALIKQYISENPILSIMTAEEQNKYISSLIMSTADVLEYPDNKGLYYTPRVQGAGLINIQKALSAQSYLTVSGSDKAKADLGDSQSGEYSFIFTINNSSNNNITYNLSSIIQTDKSQKDTDGNVYNTLVPLSIADNADIVMTVDGEDVEAVTVNAGESVDITVNITLKSDFVDLYMQDFPYGFYIDGYIFVTSPSGDDVPLNIPFMGFCGDWSEYPVFDSTIYDEEQSITGMDNSLTAVGKDNSGYFGYVIGKNYYTDTDNLYISIGNNSVKNYTDNSDFSSSFILPNFYLLRDAIDYKISISDMKGNILFSQTLGFMSSYVGEHEAFKELLYNSNVDSLRNFFSSLGEGKYIYSVSANSIGTDGSADVYDVVSYEFTVDNTIPKSVSSKTYVKDGKVYLELSASDNNAIQGFELYTATYNYSKKSYDYADKICDLVSNGYISEDSYSLENVEFNDDGSATFLYDITNLSSQLTRLSIISENGNEVPSSLKIVYKAVDYAFNYSPAKTADTIAYGSVTFKFTDQNGNGVSDVAVSLGGVQKTSTSDGKIVFEHIKPNIYTASIISVPKDYELNNKAFLIQVSNESLDVQKNVDMTYTGTILEQSNDLEGSEASQTESLSEDLSVSSDNIQSDDDKDKNKDSDPENTHNTGDNSIYAIVFVGTLLAISVASLLVSKQRSKR